MKVIEIYHHVNIANGHDGLHQIAAEDDIDLGALQKGTFIVFLNSKKDRIKLFAHNDTYAYYRLKKGQIMTNQIIKDMVLSFGEATASRTVNHRHIVNKAAKLLAA